MSVSDINRVVLVGRLTRDPELRSLASGTALCSLRVACNSRRKDAQGDYQEKPNYFSVSVFGSQAEAVGHYMSRGRRLAVDGHLEWSEWETAEGARRQSVGVVAERVQFLDGPSDHNVPEALSEDDPGEEAGHDLAGVGAGMEADIAF